MVGYRRCAEHHRQSGVVFLRSARAVGDGRYGVFVVAGGGASGLPELADGDSNLAIAAGVNLLLSPAVTRSFDQAEAMSPTGRCHAFDASADGFVRGEGCGVAVLKRLTDALRDGDRVLAVVRGSAVNQDGRSNGLMAPNRPRRWRCCAPPTPMPASSHARSTTSRPTEPARCWAIPSKRALGTVLGRGRPRCSAAHRRGQVQSGSFGGRGRDRGFIKAVLAVQRGHIPANLGFENPIRTSRLRICG